MVARYGQRTIKMEQAQHLHLLYHCCFDSHDSLRRTSSKSAAHKKKNTFEFEIEKTTLVQI
jgi:hypothetical protein